MHFLPLLKHFHVPNNPTSLSSLNTRLILSSWKTNISPYYLYKPISHGELNKTKLHCLHMQTKNLLVCRKSTTAILIKKKQRRRRRCNFVCFAHVFKLDTTTTSTMMMMPTRRRTTKKTRAILLISQENSV